MESASRLAVFGAWVDEPILVRMGKCSVIWKVRLAPIHRQNPHILTIP
jgi:hypothetical protein